MEELMQTYNKILVNFRLAEHFFDDETVDESEKLKWQDELIKITEKLNLILIGLKKINVKWVDVEVVNGFLVEYRVKRMQKYFY